MPSIQIKDVPAEVHAVLRRRAAVEGKSLQEYLLGQLVEQTRLPTLDEVLDRAGSHTGGHLPPDLAEETLRSMRGEL